MYENFIRARIKELRLKKGVSEHQMDCDLGRGKSYIQNITSGKSLPTMKGFLNICAYFGITPREFFDKGTERPALISVAVDWLQLLEDNDAIMILRFIERLKDAKAAAPAASVQDIPVP